MGVDAPLGALWRALLAAIKFLGANWDGGFSCHRPGELPSENWDPSCALGFLDGFIFYFMKYVFAGCFVAFPTAAPCGVWDIVRGALVVLSRSVWGSFSG